jgi:membrane-bound inhibitor of C-type lysozyme
MHRRANFIIAFLQVADMTRRPVTAAATGTSGYPRAAPSPRATWGMALLGGVLPALTACAPAPARTDTRLSAAPDATPTRKPLAACTPAQLAFQLDSGDGRFNGMSHSGTALMVRNIDTLACSVPAQPLPGFANSSRQALNITARPTPGVQPASTSTITLAPGATISSDLRWVSGDVYDGGGCVSPAFITLAIGKHTLTTDFTGHVCGPDGQPPEVTVKPFQPGATSMTAAAKALIYTCASGRIVQAAYPDTDTAVLTLDGQMQSLHIAISADGARYVGKQWQWWTKGMHDAWLAPLQPGETIASAHGEACTAP